MEAHTQLVFEAARFLWTFGFIKGFFCFTEVVETNLFWSSGSRFPLDTPAFDSWVKLSCKRGLHRSVLWTHRLMAAAQVQRLNFNLLFDLISFHGWLTLSSSFFPSFAMLKNLQCVCLDPAPFRSQPIRRNMEERAIRFELERQACQSLRKGGIPALLWLLQHQRCHKCVMGRDWRVRLSVQSSKLNRSSSRCHPSLFSMLTGSGGLHVAGLQLGLSQLVCSFALWVCELRNLQCSLKKKNCGTEGSEKGFKCAQTNHQKSVKNKNRKIFHFEDFSFSFSLLHLMGVMGNVYNRIE